MNHISFPSIVHFRDVIRQVKSNSNHHVEPAPTLVFKGTVKLHGTNHSVCLSPNNEFFTQSRERITTLESDHAGSAAWSLANKSVFMQLFSRIINTNIVGAEDTMQVFGEWCGGNIQSGVGLSYLPKQFIVCAIRISKGSDSQEFLPLSELPYLCEGLLPYVLEFPTFYVTINFGFPERAQEELIKLTQEVERDCPVSRQLLGESFDKELIGEGIVWTTEYKGQTLRFKVKGEKHSSSKVKVLVPVDIEKLESIREFVEMVVTESRLTQGLEHVAERTPTNTGAFIKWVMNDIIKEEADTIVGNGFTTKEIAGPCSTAIRKWFLNM